MPFYAENSPEYAGVQSTYDFESRREPRAPSMYRMWIEKPAARAEAMARGSGSIASGAISAAREVSKPYRAFPFGYRGRQGPGCDSEGHDSYERLGGCGDPSRRILGAGGSDGRRAP